MDERDQRILEELRRDAWRPLSAIARQLGLPRATVRERVERMRRAGIIRGICALPGYEALGLGTLAFVLVSFLPGTTSQRALAQEIAKLPYVQEVHIISGEYDILLKVRAASVEDVGRLVVDRLRALPGVGKTVTSLSFFTLKEEP
ncbi:MAG: transcriptional regulator [Nitrososphaerota archaeon]